MPKRRVTASPRVSRWPRVADSTLLRLVVCPKCHGQLTRADRDLTCNYCPRTYQIVDGVPALVVDPGKGAAQRQASFFDEVDNAEFEIERPQGAPWLYHWYFEEKFRRSVSALRSVLRGATALTVCGGSGMDAEFLARAGCRVVMSDVSMGACRRAVERACRRDVPLTVVAANAERLPFADRSIDLVYVHDGLHHLEQPFVGLAEMARVARFAISITEPAKAAVTALAVRLGLALEVEDAGNRVARLAPAEIESSLAEAGFKMVSSQRYAMYYKHEPGRAIEMLSKQGIRSVVTSSMHLFNTLAGGVGNKLTVQAVRGSEGDP